MAKKEDVAFREFVEDVLGKLPEDKRKTYEPLLSDEQVARELFRGGLREEEFHRRLTELDKEKKSYQGWQAEQAAVRKWYDEVALPEANKLAKERDELREQLIGAKRQLEDAGVDPENYGIKVPAKRGDVNGNDLGAAQNELAQYREQLNSVRFLVDRALPRLLSDVLKVQARAIKEDWKVDASEVLDEALKTGVTPDVAFDRLTAKEREQREEKRIESLKKEYKELGRREAMKERASSPDRPMAQGPNILDNLAKTDKAVDKYGRIDGAVQAFIEGTAGKPGDMALISTGMAV